MVNIHDYTKGKFETYSGIEIDFINHINGTFWGSTRGTAAKFIHQFKIYQQP